MSVVVERDLTPAQLEVARAKLKAAKGIELTGNAGTFAVDNIAGSYRYDGARLRVEVTKHPRFVGGYIEGQLNKELDAVAAS